MDPAPGVMSLLLRPAMPHREPAAVVGNTLLACLFWDYRTEYQLDVYRKYWEKYKADAALPADRANVEKWGPFVERDLKLAKSLFDDDSRLFFLSGMRKRLLLDYVLMEIRDILDTVDPPVARYYRSRRVSPSLLDSKSNKDMVNASE